MNILCIGDVVGGPGREAVIKFLPQLKEKFKVDFTVCNAENSAGGFGITKNIAEQLFKAGCDVLTLGDHVWDKKEVYPYLMESPYLIRPANFPEGVPGRGFCVKSSLSGVKVAVINLLGRVFMRYNVHCPFLTLTEILKRIRRETPVIVVDMHAEATSEKTALGHYADGEVSAVVGTHTHIQTADEKILPKKTAYLTDLGMTGPYDSVIGQKKELIIQRFLTSMPQVFEVAKDEVFICAALVSVDETTGRAHHIERVNWKVDNNN